jgi:integrase
MLEFKYEAPANDDAFNKRKHPTSAIEHSVSTIKDYPHKLRIYQTNSSPFWQVRCFIKGKVHTQSLKTSFRNVAMRAAKEFFHIKVAELYQSKIVEREISETLFGDVIESAIAKENSRAKRGELSKLGLTIFTNRVLKTVNPYFGKMPLKAIGYKQIDDFIQYLTKNESSTTTIQQYIVATRKILNHAYEHQLIHHVPKFPTIKVAHTPRGSFSLSEYKALVRTSKQHIGRQITALDKTQKKRGRFLVNDFTFITNELQWMIRFMVNSFIRPTDLKNLQHKHVTVVRGQNTYLRLNLPESKKHDKPIVTMQGAVFVYEKLLEHHKKNHHASPDDYLFMPSLKDRTHLLLYLGWQFMYVQKLTSTERNVANGMKRTLYSLRHTAITFRLLYGGNIDLLTLARNARTSVEMVEKFYSSNLSAEMNIDLLQGKRKKT